MWRWLVPAGLAGWYWLSRRKGRASEKVEGPGREYPSEREHPPREHAERGHHAHGHHPHPH
jgi:hypothetical protein